MTKHNQHVGSDFDDFLAEEALLEEVTAIALKRVIAWQLEEARIARGLGKTAMAERMRTSRSQLNRILDETDTSLTLESLSKAAQAVGYRIKIELEAA
ncbi:MAG: Fis family transcriptional regulator [Gimesia sp.]|uniref:Fis family transcriptional regulator n=1 Tax=Abyssibacter profundi TaxID=2182787 RepID=A0A383XPP3_9GAMM|nr:XRE family transcriptional regulator [Abyssibacter profundi]MBN67839.1 Fis family transcriptional regulator [Gimesia sp.]PWN54597.1 Fis family transcriptional regulator [Abyssibacter profundi]